MFREAGLAKGLMALLAAIPLAIFSGYFLAKGTFGGYALVFMLLTALAFPLVMAKHYWVVVATVNSTLLMPFFPGQPQMCFVVAAFTVGTMIVNRTLTKKTEMIWVPSLVYSLVALLAVVFVTAQLRGGIGGRAFGSEMWGARRYFGVIGAVLVYFALTSRSIPRRYAGPAATVFFLSGILSASSNVIYALGSPFFFLFWFFPVELASMQFESQGELVRLSGVAFAMWAVIFTVGMRYGIRGLSDLTKPWRMMIFLSAIAISLLGGYRSSLVVIFFVFGLLFVFEGLLKSRLLVLYVLLAILGSVFVIAFVDYLPLSVQRSLSFLPIDVDPVAKQDAASTLDWRIQIWKTVFPEIPKYLWLGKGYSYGGTDYMLVQEAISRGYYNAYEHILISGNYHSGILTVLIPFGVWGMAAFLWFFVASLRVLYRNYKWGPPELKRINTFLLAYFAGYSIYYFFLYGQFDIELLKFVGTVGLSVALNNGVWTYERRWREDNESTDPEEGAPEEGATPVAPVAGLSGRTA